MQIKSSVLLPLSILAGIIIISGCTGLDPTTIAKSNAMIKQFLNEHPNAKIVATHFSAEQSANIINQIRQDCDNPYINQKEFYRITITDPDTNLYATVWVDWKNQTVECAYKVGTEGNKTIDKPPQPGCQNHATYKCDSGHVYWYDSCGNRQEKKESCNNGCSDNTCLSQPTKTCTDSDNGKDYYKKGTVTSAGQSLSDQCTDDFTLAEKFCSEGESKWETYKCPAGCKDGACVQPSCTEGQIQTCGHPDVGICKSGTQKCVNGKWTECSGGVGPVVEILGNNLDDDCDNVIDESGQGPYSCTDSDNGKDYNSKGRIEGFLPETQTYPTLWDECEKDYMEIYYGNSNYASSNRLFEYYCTPEGHINNDTYTCPYGCEGGACLKFSSCNANKVAYTIQVQDTPLNININGYEYNIKVVSVPVATEAQISVNNQYASVKEGNNYEIAGLSIFVENIYYFSNKNYNSVKLIICSQSSIPACIDSDNGIDYYTGGYVYSKDGRRTDTCSMGRIYEKSCANGAEISTEFTCTNGCYIDACNKPEWTCTDGDSGTGYYQKSQITGVNRETRQMQSIYDTCLLNNNPAESCTNQQDCKIAEYYCSDSVFIAVDNSTVCPQGCSNGACVKICTDSDNGINYYTKGTITTVSAPRSDYCSSSNSLIEYYCNGTDDFFSFYQCPNGCSDGICLSQQPVQNSYCDSNNVCKIYEGESVITKVDEEQYDYNLTAVSLSSSSVLFSINGTWADISKGGLYMKAGLSISVTDIHLGDGSSNGYATFFIQDCYGPYGPGETTNYFIKESITFRNGSSNVFYDYCMNSITLRQYRCDTDHWYQYSDFDCPYGCSNGVCLNQTCYDSDGQNYYSQGYVLSPKDDGLSYDVCSDSTVLTEYHCSGNQETQIAYQCPLGCYNGACRCYDSDDGQNYNVKGTVTNNQGAFMDFCTNNTLSEYMCFNQNAYKSDYQCPNGCSDGKCN